MDSLNYAVGFEKKVVGRSLLANYGTVVSRSNEQVSSLR
jgi:hypothetical protein